MAADRARIARVAARSDGVLATEQCLRLGASRSWVDRQVLSGRWQRVHVGVLVVHSGPLGWRTRARAALVYAGPGAALSHTAAGYVHGLVAQPPAVIDVMIPESRRVRPSRGIAIHRRRGIVSSAGSLPSVGAADTLLDLVAACPTEDEQVALVCAAVRGGVRPRDVVEAARRRPRLRGRSTVLCLVGQVAEGVESPLERRYRRDVERAHRLPTARLQVRHRVGGRWVRADCLYEDLGVRCELDGELAHPGGRTAADTWRDNAVLIERAELTLRYRWEHVAGDPCAVASQVARALRSRGWSARPRRCGPTCTLA